MPFGHGSRPARSAGEPRFKLGEGGLPHARWQRTYTGARERAVEGIEGRTGRLVIGQRHGMDTRPPREDAAIRHPFRVKKAEAEVAAVQPGERRERPSVAGHRFGVSGGRNKLRLLHRGRTAGLTPAGTDCVQERVFSGLGHIRMPCEIVNRAESAIRSPPLPLTVLHVMLQRVEAGCCHVGIRGEVPGEVKMTGVRCSGATVEATTPATEPDGRQDGTEHS